MFASLPGFADAADRIRLKLSAIAAQASTLNASRYRYQHDSNAAEFVGASSQGKRKRLTVQLR